MHFVLCLVTYTKAIIMDYGLGCLLVACWLFVGCLLVAWCSTAFFSIHIQDENKFEIC
jgi:hypothetical protein